MSLSVRHWKLSWWNTSSEIVIKQCESSQTQDEQPLRQNHWKINLISKAYSVDIVQVQSNYNFASMIPLTCSWRYFILLVWDYKHSKFGGVPLNLVAYCYYTILPCSSRTCWSCTVEQVSNFSLCSPVSTSIQHYPLPYSHADVIANVKFDMLKGGVSGICKHNSRLETQHSNWAPPPSSTH